MAKTIDSESVAQDQIKAFVDRILRMKEEAKAINDDIREIYNEAKGNGFDKTILGKLVNYVEKRKKDANALAEGEALFDLYLAAYFGVGTVVATHTHETESDEDFAAGVETTRQLAADAIDAADLEPIPTPDDGGDTAEPDSGLDLHGEVASFQQDGAEVARGAHNPEVAGSIPAPATNFDQADLTDKTAEPSGSAAPSVNALCLKAKRGEQCIFAHKGYSCADCNYAWAIDRVKKREAA